MGEEKHMEAILRYSNITTGFITDGPACNCGQRDWFPQGDNYWICSYCERKRFVAHRGVVLNGPICNCGKKDWFIGNEIVRCSYCERKREVVCEGYIVGGPKCNCDCRDWFVGETIYRCSYCERKRNRV